MNIFEPFNVLYRYRKMLIATAMVDIRAKFAGSLLGTFWLILYPVLLLTAYSFVYIFIFQVRFGEMSAANYVMLIFAGLIPFLGFTEGLASSIVSVTANSALLKNTMYPIDIIPAKAVFTSQCTEVVGLLILFMAVILDRRITVYALLVFPIWCFQLMFGIGIGWIVSCLNVYIKDLQNVVNLITIFLMMISPIAYTVDMIPEGLRPFLAWNPLYYFITAYQDCLVVGCFPRGNVLMILMIFSVLIFMIGYWFFSKMKLIFSDNI